MRTGFKRGPHPGHSTTMPARYNILKDNDKNLSGEDVPGGPDRDHLASSSTDAQFEGQTKAKLGNTEVRTLVDSMVYEKLTDLLGGEPRRGRRPSLTRL